ncbi:MAG: radical SAM protein [candidate division Zixibacteria bacterium]|nr:radical SAM protein [candidate division Zixibacteria bacterium]
MITDATIAILDACNARCVMCDIWQHKDKNYMLPDEYRRLPSTLKHINIGGGEPFMRKDLPELLWAIKETCPDARMVLSTNGFQPRVAEKMISKLPEIAIRVSLDGVGSLHDEVRRIKEGYNKVMETIRIFKAAGVKDLGIGATASKVNQHRFYEIKRLADQLKIEFTCAVVHNSDTTFGNHTEIEAEVPVVNPQLRQIRDSFLGSSKPKDWARGYFVETLIDYLDKKPRPIPCTAGDNFFFLQSNGDVYPCNILDMKMGNIREESIEEIFARNQKIKNFCAKCNQCWMICTVVPILRKKPTKPLGWVVKNKLAHEFKRLTGRNGNSKQEELLPEFIPIEEAETVYQRVKVTQTQGQA